MARTLASHLAELERSELEALLADNKQACESKAEELRGLRYEGDLIAQALARKVRRGSSAGRRQSKSRSVRTSVKVTRDQVLAALRRSHPNSKFSPADLVKALAADGIELDQSAARQHLRRALKAGKVTRVGDMYILTGEDGVGQHESFNGHGQTAQLPSGGRRREGSG